MVTNNCLEMAEDFIQKHSNKYEFDFTLKKVGNKFVCGFTPIGGHMNNEWWLWSFEGKNFNEAIEGAIEVAEKNINRFK